MARVLIIDDSPTVLSTLCSGLGKDGYEVEGLSSFGELASVLERFQPDVIVLDLLMPGFNGVQFARFIQGYEENPPPIILHSGSDPDLIKIAARKIKPFEIVAKGTRMLDIRRSVSRAVAHANGWTTSGRKGRFSTAAE